MPKGYRKPADWGGFAMAIADAQHDEQLAAVKRDDPRVRIPQDTVWAEVKRERDALRAENAELRKNLVDTKTAARWGEQTETQLEAEVERWQRAIAEVVEKQTLAEAEAERLRAALTELSDHEKYGMHRGLCCMQAVTIVHRTLVRPKE